MRRLGWGLAVLLTPACRGLEQPATGLTGVLRLFAQAGDTVQFVGRLEAEFFDGTLADYPDSRQPPDACQLGDLAAQPGLLQQNLSAGDSIQFASDAGAAYLYPTADPLGNVSYVPPDGFVTLTPGTSVTFTIPGAANGFPAATLTAPTAPPIAQLSAFPDSVSLADSIVVTWAPAGDDSSAFEVALRFASSGATIADRQLLCLWRDDGRGVIAGSLLSEWSTTTVRYIEASRYRTLRQQLAGDAVLYFLATYDTMPAPVP